MRAHRRGGPDRGEPDVEERAGERGDHRRTLEGATQAGLVAGVRHPHLLPRRGEAFERVAPPADEAHFEPRAAGLREDELPRIARDAEERERHGSSVG